MTLHSSERYYLFLSFENLSTERFLSSLMCFFKFDLPSACFLNFPQYSGTFLIMEYCLYFPNLFSKSVHKIVKVYKFRIFCDLKNWISQFCPWDNSSTITWFKHSTYESQGYPLYQVNLFRSVATLVSKYK